MVFHFYIFYILTGLSSINISSLCSGEIIISSTFLESPSGTDFGYTTLLAILFLINSPAARAAL